MEPYDFAADRTKQQEELARLMKQNAAPAGIPAAESQSADPAPSKMERLGRFNEKARALLSTVRLGVFGGMSALLGILLLWAGFQSGFEPKSAGLGAVLLGLGLLALKYAREAWRNFRNLTKA